MVLSQTPPPTFKTVSRRHFEIARPTSDVWSEGQPVTLKCCNVAGMSGSDASARKPPTFKRTSPETATASGSPATSHSVRRVMVLRGDGEQAGESVSVADVVEQVQAAHPLDIAVACYPETHPMATSAAADLDCLKRKCDAGATRAVAQMVFSADAFLRFRDRAQAHGIDVPLHAGILPVVDFAKAKRLAAQCGAELPRAFEQAYEGTEGNGPVQRELGIAFATELSATLAAEGVDGLHIYAMNSPGLATELVESLAIAPHPQPVSQPTINGASAHVVHASQLARARSGLRSVVGVA